MKVTKYSSKIWRYDDLRVNDNANVEKENTQCAVFYSRH